jgi:glycosyltransferase involved in cell wall biosynthesis
MTILHTETLKKWGGQQNRVLTEAIWLSKKGLKFIIACNKNSILANKSIAAGIKTYEVNMTKKAYPLTIPKLVHIILKEKVDIVCTHSSVDSWAGGIAAWLTRRRLVRFKHNLYRIKKDPLTRFIYSLPHRFISVNNTAAEVLKETGYIRPEKITRVYGALDTGKFNSDNISNTDKVALKHSLGIPQNALVIGNTSGFTEVKGQRYLLEAANKVFRNRNNVFLLLVGRIGKKEKIIGQIQTEFLRRVILPGLRTDIPLLLSIMDIFVFPSTVEAFGNSLIEAMAMAKPVLVSDIPSFREFMTDGVDGIFFKSADSENLLNRLSHLIDNPEKWQILGYNARKTVLGKFLPDRMLDETENIYLDLINTRG